MKSIIFKWLQTFKVDYYIEYLKWEDFYNALEMHNSISSTNTVKIRLKFSTIEIDVSLVYCKNGQRNWDVHQHLEAIKTTQTV